MTWFSGRDYFYWSSVKSELMSVRYSVQFGSSVMSDSLRSYGSCQGFPVHHKFPDLAQTPVHRVGDAIQPSHPPSSPSTPAFNLSQHQDLF